MTDRGAAPEAKQRIPAIEGWFDPDAAEPALLGRRCPVCGTFSFPPGAPACPNPRCQEATPGHEVPLSRRGRVWSFTDARYQPPEPYVAADPFQPFCIAAVELADERLVVLGQVVAGITVDDLRVGDEVELVVDTLYEDDEHEYLVWKWRPVNRG
jgi:uncharacterized protein